MNRTISLQMSLWSRLDEEEFFKFCQMNPKWDIERDHNGRVYFMKPVGLKSSHLESVLIGELYSWNKIHQKGGVFSSSTGFTLPDTSVFSPDAAFVLQKRIDELTAAEKKRFAPIAPDFVAEIRSSSDQLDMLFEKMDRYILNGVRLAWLIDPIDEKAWVYAPGQTTGAVADFTQTLGGGEVLPGFQFPLALLK